MKASAIIMRGVAWIIISMLVIPPGVPAQDSAQPEQTDRFREEELAQMLAPIALYPDSLIAQILMASTYPLEVVEAERWLRQNNSLKGDLLNDALREKPWDPSVKSLCHFPDVLFAMSDKLDQTRKLGDAFLGQEDEVMATVQVLRQKAGEQGNLKPTAEQNVIYEGDTIRLEPTNPQVVYVPVYDPYYAYGPWWYPAYPPWYWYYPQGVVISGGFITFGLPFYIGIGLFSWSWFDWHRHHIYVDYDHVRHFHKHRRDGRGSGKSFWEHNPVHRKGVAYRDRTSSGRFMPLPTRTSRTSPETRGYPTRSIERRTVGPARGASERREGALVPRTRTAPERSPGIESGKEATVPQVRTAPERTQRSRVQDNPFRGIGEGNFERKAGQRGSESLRGSQIRPQGGGTGRQGIAPAGGGFRGGGSRR